jgi:hypothetical protein
MNKLLKIRDSHGGEDVNVIVPGWDAVWTYRWVLTFQRNILPLSSSETMVHTYESTHHSAENHHRKCLQNFHYLKLHRQKENLGLFSALSTNTFINRVPARVSG